MIEMKFLILIGILWDFIVISLFIYYFGCIIKNILVKYF